MLPNKENSPSVYEIPQSASYSQELAQEVSEREVVNDSQFENAEEVASARREVEAVFLDNQAERINEEIIDRVTRRGQEIKEARDMFLSNNPYRQQIHNGAWYKIVAFKLLNSLLESATEEDLIEEESLIGADIFRIEGFRFFNTDERNWWAYHGGNKQGLAPVTVHYEVLPMGILKSSNKEMQLRELLGDGPELDNLDKATQIYHYRITQKYHYTSGLYAPQPVVSVATSQTDGYQAFGPDKKTA